MENNLKKNKIKKNKLLIENKKLNARFNLQTKNAKKLNAKYDLQTKAAEELKENEYFFKKSQDVANIGSYKFDLPKGEWFSSRVLDKIFNFNKNDKKDFKSWLKIVYKDDKKMMEDYFKNEVIKKHKSFDKEYRISVKSGSNIKWVHGLGKLFFDDKNKLISMIGTIQDITDRKNAEENVLRINCALKMVSTINQSLIHSTNEKKLLEEACNIIIDIGGYALAWVGFMEYDKDKKIHPVAIAGDKKDYVAKENFTWANSKKGLCPGGITANTGKLVIIRDILNDPRVSHLRKGLLDRGFKSIIALPLKNKRRVFGVILIYSRFLDVFAREEVEILKELASDLSFGLTTLHTQLEVSKLKKAVENSSEVVYMTDKNGIITSINKEFTKLYGYKYSEVVGKVTPRILKSGTRSPREYNILWKNLIKGKVNKDEHYNKTKNGKFIVVDSTINPILDGKNKEIIGYLAIQKDVTKIKLEQEKLKKSDLIIKNVNNIIIKWKKDGVIEYMNDYGLNIFGYKNNREVIGKKLDILIPKKESTGKDLSGLVNNIVSNPKKFVFNENENIKKDGTRFWVNWTNRAIKDKKGNPVEIITVGSDVTKLKNIEKKLEISEQKFRRLFEAAKDSILILDADSGEITDSNPFIQNLLGYSAKEFIGKKIYEISPFMDIIENKEKFEELQDKGYVYYDNLPLKTKSGIIKQVEFISNAYLVADKKVIQCNIRDITDRVKKEKELESAKSDFLSMTSHQLRTPLSATKWVLEGMSQDKNFTPKQHERFGYLVESNNRLINLVNDLLDVTRIESGKILVNKKPTDIKKLISELIISLKVLADKRNKVIKFIAPNKLNQVSCDPVLIHEALQNLINNAIIYSEDKSKEIIVSVESRKDDYLISVHNDGVIDKESEERIKTFGKFTRGVSATIVQPEGSGLGLYITRKVIEISGGTVWFESNTKHGTTFYLTIIKK